MASTTDMNIVLGQGNAVKEVHNVRKQNLELNQQFVAQQTEEKKVAIEEHEGEKNKGGSEQDRKRSRKEQSEEASNPSEGNLIDIRI
jgi:hypothetical protein